jgi:hypothetical protein
MIAFQMSVCQAEIPGMATYPTGDASIVLLERIQHLRDPCHCFGWRCSGLEEFTKFLTLLFIIGWVPRDIGWFTLEEIGNEHLIRLLLVTVGKNIGALQSLGIEAENIEDDENAVFGTLFASCVLDRMVRYDSIAQSEEDIQVFRPSA